MAFKDRTNKIAIPMRSGFASSRKKRFIVIFAFVVMVTYSVVTLFPFYALLIRSFVPTKEATTLHLRPPKGEEINMDQQVGNLAVFYDLDLRDLKEAIGIPATEFIMARTTLREISQKYDIPEEEIKSYFKNFYVYNGWFTLLFNTPFFMALLRTFVVTVISCILIVVLSIFTGYGLAGLRRRDQMAVYNLYLLQMVIPTMLILLPQYQLVQWITRLIPRFDSPGITRGGVQLLTIILINIKGTALSTMIFTSFISAIPKDLEDAARIDGTTRLQYVRRILFPLLKVPIVSILVIQMPLYYNLFLEPYVYLDERYTTVLPLMQTVAGQFSTNFQVIYATIVGSIVPLVIIYLIFRRFFVQGVLAGAIKG
jgi:raffinose/stachyose/melibiose transport system permease protein